MEQYWRENEGGKKLILNDRLIIRTSTKTHLFLTLNEDTLKSKYFGSTRTKAVNRVQVLQKLEVGK